MHNYGIEANLNRVAYIGHAIIFGCVMVIMVYSLYYLYPKRADFNE